MPTRNVNLTDHYDSSIETSITEGRFANASEAVRAGLNLLERQDAEDRAKLEWLRSAAKDAFGQLDRGKGIRFGSMEELETYIEEIGGTFQRRSPPSEYVPKKPVHVAATLTPSARQDIRDISRWSELKFGKEAAAAIAPCCRRLCAILKPMRPGPVLRNARN